MMSDNPSFTGNATNKLLLRALLALVWATLAMCHTAAIATQPAIVIDDQFTERTIGLDLSFLEDPTAKLTLQDVRGAELANQFTPSTKPNPSFGFTKSAYWARFALEDTRNINHAHSDLPLILTLAYAQTDFAELWCVNKQGVIELNQQTGDHIQLTEWSTSFRNPAFEIAPNAHICWLRVQSSGSLQLPLTLSTHAAFVEQRVTDSTLQALYFGALLVMFVYNGLLAFTTRSSAYASYTLFLLSYGLFLCSFSGIGYQLLWPNAIGFADKILPFFMACIGITAALFTIILLDLRRSAPRFYKFGVVMVVLFTFILLAAWLLPYEFSIKSVISVALFWCVFLLGSGVTLAWRGMRLAQIYLAAWLAFIIGSTIVIFAALGLLPINAFTRNAQQIGSAIEFVMLSLALAYRIKSTQQTLLQTQQEISANLLKSEQKLEVKVKERTQELQNANKEIFLAYSTVEIERAQAVEAREQAEAAQQETAQALADLKATQTQLIAAEKMASLGLLVSNVAHEINTPIGAVKSSGAFIAETLDTTLADMPRLFSMLDGAPRGLFIQLISQGKSQTQSISVREERTLTKAIAAQLEQTGLDDTNRKARQLTKLRAHQNPLDYLPLLQHPESDFILQVAGNIADIIGGTHNINTAVEKVSRVVYALKALSGDDVLHASIVAPLSNALDKALTKFQSQMQSIDLVKNFQSDMQPIHADHDAMEQLCIHLVMNALQASNYSGKLTVELHTTQRNNTPQAEIRISDNGSGIADDIKDRIFEPFFTTRTSGEGSGMGLAIVKRIVEQHQGKIEVQTVVGVGTTVTVTLPYHAAT
jgi:signal transduction histidine kinase